MDEIDTHISKKNFRNHENPLFLIEIERSWKINEKSWIFTLSQWFFGNLGVNLIHPPTQVMCMPTFKERSPRPPFAVGVQRVPEVLDAAGVRVSPRGGAELDEPERPRLVRVEPVLPRPQ